MTRLRANGIHLCYDSVGNPQDEIILLISGLGAQMIRWTRPFCQYLADYGYRVIRFDNRDSGLSTHFTASPPPDFAALAAAISQGKPPVVPYTLDDMVADSVGLLDALSVDRVHVIGRSMGGMIAQLLTSQYPRRVLSLTSIMSGTGNPRLPAAAPDVMAMLTQPAPLPDTDNAGFIAHRLAFAKRIAGRGFPFDETLHRRLIEQESRRAWVPGGFARQIAAIAATGDIRSRLGGIHVPTLVIHGTDDPLIPSACGEDTAASVPDAKLMLIKGMGHDIPVALYQPLAHAIIKNCAEGTARAT